MLHCGLADDPPEYNVKERLKELNAELAAEPDPDDRHHRVGFKEELVDLVAPPPEVSEDEETPRKAKEKEGEGEEKGEKEEGQDEKDKKKQLVVERDGKFDVVADNELTADERAMLDLPDKEEDKGEGGGRGRDHTDSRGDHQRDSDHWGSNDNRRQPAPPSKPRPATANGHTRRNVRHVVDTRRPQTASPARRSQSQNSSSSTLQNFNHQSKYAMSKSDKQKAQEQAK
jgi:hypothetical protein